MESTIGIVILVLTLAAFLAAGIAALVLWFKGPKLPKGHKFEHQFAGNKAIVVIEESISSIKDPAKNQVVEFLVDSQRFKGQDLAEKCAIAMAAIEQAFADKDIKNADIQTAVFLFKDDNSFNNTSPVGPNWAKNVAAYSVTTGATFARPVVPMAVIRSKYMKSVAERGQPAIHELVHILNQDAGRGYQHDHTDANLWAGHGSDTVESIAVVNWTDMVK